MPAAYAHDIAALRAKEMLAGESPAWLDAEMPSFLLGAQGPDLFFFYGIFPPWRTHALNLDGAALHGQSGALWARALLRYCARAGATARAWTLGYLCHWSTDAACHPYVRSRERERPYAHGLLEMGADTMLFRARGGKGTPRHLAYIADIDAMGREELAQMFAATVPDALPGRRVGIAEARRNFADAHRLHSFLYSPDGRRYRAIGRLEGLLGKRGLVTGHLPPVIPEMDDPLNERHAAWGCEGRTDSYPELIEAAAGRAAGWMKLALAYWEGKTALEDALVPMGNLRMEDGVEDETAKGGARL